MKIKLTIRILLLALLALGAPAWAAKVEVCHIPPGNPGNLHTITISETALQAHLAHGDFLGDCSAASCPCMRIPQFNLVLANANFCFGSSESIAVTIDPPTETSTPAVALASTSEATAPVCGYADSNIQTSIILSVTPAQADLCFQLVIEAAASRGVSCAP